MQVTQHKLHLAQSNLTECEHNRERKLKIMRKTHQSALALKQALIQELQDIISEKDEIINTKLRNSQADDVNTKPCLSDSQVSLQYVLLFFHKYMYLIFLGISTHYVGTLPHFTVWLLTACEH